MGQDLPPSPSPGRVSDWVWLRRLLLALLVVSLALFVWQVRHVLLLLFGATLFAILLLRLRGKLARWTGLPDGVSLALTVFLLAGLGVAGVLMMGAQLASQFAELSQRLPRSIQAVVDFLNATPVGRFLIDQMQVFGQESGGSVLSNLSRVVAGIVIALSDLVLILVAAIYLAAQPRLYQRGLLQLMPPQHRPRMAEFLDEAGHALWRWLLGVLVLMVAIGVMTTLGLWLLGIPAALALGLIAGALEFIPIAGPFLAAVPAVLVALTLDGWHALYVVLLYTGIQQFENNVLIPLVQREAVSLPPVLTLSALVMFGLVFGVLGVLFATPLAVMVLVATRMFYIRGVLGESTTLPGR